MRIHWCLGRTASIDRAASLAWSDRRGSVLRSVDRVPIKVRSSMRRTNRHLWAQTYDRECGISWIAGGVSGGHRQEHRPSALPCCHLPARRVRLLVNCEADELYVKVALLLEQATPDGARPRSTNLQSRELRDRLELCLQRSRPGRQTWVHCILFRQPPAGVLSAGADAPSKPWDTTSISPRRMRPWGAEALLDGYWNGGGCRLHRAQI